MDVHLRCNRQTGRYCRTPLTERAIVTTCSFVSPSSFLALLNDSAVIFFVFLVPPNWGSCKPQPTVASARHAIPLYQIRTTLSQRFSNLRKNIRRVYSVVWIQTPSWSVREGLCRSGHTKHRKRCLFTRSTVFSAHILTQILPGNHV